MTHAHDPTSPQAEADGSPSLGYEPCHTMPGFYDGPRDGIADFGGRPHLYTSTWADLGSDAEDVYELRAVDEETFRLALESWAIWLRWSSAHARGETTIETHPALPADRARRDAIDVALEARLAALELRRPDLLAHADFRDGRVRFVVVDAPPLAAPAPSPCLRPFFVDAWAEAVLHVLAHAQETEALAGSLYDPGYVAEVATTLGPAEARGLGEDARRLGRLFVANPRSFGCAVDAAQLFASPERALACSGRALAEVADTELDAPHLRPLVNQRAVDLLRAAAEAELPLLSRLPPVRMDMDALAAALEDATVVAPRLHGCRVGVSRVLGERALVRGTEIRIGAVSIEHAAWMAAEKATVVEVEEHHRAFGGKAVAMRARAVLGERARAAGRGEAYDGWRAGD